MIVPTTVFAAGTTQHPAARHIRFAPQPVIGSVDVQAIPRVNDPIYGDEVARLDALAQEIVGTAINDYLLAPIIYNSDGSPVTFVSSDELIATVSDSGFVTYVSAGTVTISITAGHALIELELEVAATPPLRPYWRISRFRPGTVGRSIVDTFESHVDFSGGISIFSTADHASGVYVRNPDLFLKNVDLTCIPGWNSRQGGNRAGTLVAPDLLVCVDHYPLYKGDRVRYVDNNNVTHERIIIDTRTTGPLNDGPEFWLCRIDEDLPSSIRPVKVLPADYADYLGSLGMEDRLPFLDAEEIVGVYRNRRNELLATKLNTLSSSVNASAPQASRYQPFWAGQQGGDSGSPMFLVIAGELVLTMLYTAWYNGYNIADSISMLNTFAADMGSEHTLTQYDFSSFPTFA